jgi:hypothetical protein
MGKQADVEPGEIRQFESTQKRRKLREDASQSNSIAGTGAPGVV